MNIEQFSATLGRSDISASGKINNVLAYFSPDQTMRGTMRVRSNFFDADEWMEGEETVASNTLSPAELNANPTANEPTEIFDRFDFDVDAEINQLNYATYRPKNLRVIGNVKPNRLEIANGSGELGESSFSASGVINDLFDYTFDEGVLTGNLAVRSGFLNVADFMDETVAASASPAPAAAPASSAVIPIPRNINLKMDVIADRIQYTDIQINGLRGNVVIQDGQAVIQDGSANLLGGSMGFAGAYDTSEPGDPGFRFQYDLSSLDFGQAFAVLNSFAALAPVGKFLSGRFNSELMVEGKLGPDLFPKLNSINANGLISTAEAAISGFKPLQTIGRTLNINALKESTTIRNIMTVFNIQDGRVNVEPFTVNLIGTRMLISGSHGLNTDMDYRIKTAIPRELIQGNIVTGSALNALDKLAGQAGRLGLNISPGDTLNLNIGLTGTISDPKVGFDLLGSRDGEGSVKDQVVANIREQINAEVDERKEELTGKINDEKDRLTAEAETRAQLARDSIRTIANTQAELLKKQAADKLRGALGGKSDTTKTDSIKIPGAPAVEDKVNEVKDKLEKFNPFKRKSGGEPHP